MGGLAQATAQPHAASWGLHGEGAPPERVEQPRPEALRPHSQPGYFSELWRQQDGASNELPGRLTGSA